MVKELLSQLKSQHEALGKPMALLFHLQLREAHPELSNTKIRKVLRYMANGLTYQGKLAKGGHRYNLNGEVNGEVTPAQQQIAREKLKGNGKRKATKKVAEKASSESMEGVAKKVGVNNLKPKLSLKK